MIGDLVLALRSDAFDASVRHDMSFFDEFQSGRIISRITSDTEEFAQVVLLVTDLIGQILLVAHSTGRAVHNLLAIDADSAGAGTLCPSPGHGLPARCPLCHPRGFSGHRRGQCRHPGGGDRYQRGQEFRQEAAIYETFSRVNRQSYAINLRRGFVLSNIFPILNALAGVGTAALVYWGGLSATTGAISLGAWYLFIVSVDRFWFPMINVSAFWSQFQAGLAASERIFALIDAEPTVHQIGDQPAHCTAGRDLFRAGRFSLHRTGAGAARTFPCASRPARAWPWSGTPAPARAASPS